MRKTLALLALLVVCAAQANAQGAGLRVFGVTPVAFHKYNAATNYPDSNAVAGKASWGSDTTVAVSLASMGLPAPQLTGAADTTSWFGVIIGAGSAAPAADSVYVGTQVSLDGNKWVTVTPLRVNFAATTKPPVASAILLETGSNDAFGRIYSQERLLGQYVNAMNGTAPTEIQMYGWPLIRFIVTWSAADAGSSFSLSIFKTVQ